MRSSLSRTRARSNFSKSLVGFIVGDVRYAVDISVVSEIINPLACVNLPHAPEVVVGVADHRGGVVPIIDLRRRFGLPPRGVDRRTKWVLVRAEGRTVGLVVDAVTEVFGTDEASKEGAPLLGKGDDMRGIDAVHRVDGALVFLLDVERVAAPAIELDIDGAALARTTSPGTMEGE